VVAALQRSKKSRDYQERQRLDKVDRAEPNRLLFQPPGDYKIVDEEGTFTITLRRP
jgi:hypothetical protein